jgi:peptidoglycan-associated lipoprotein
MRRRSGTIVFASLLAVAMAGGCAKQPPATTAPPVAGAAGAAGGAGTGPAGGSSSRGPSTTGLEGQVVPAAERGGPVDERGAGAGSGASSRPAPAAFTAVPALQDIYFDFDKYTIRPDAARTLEVSARWLKEHPSYRLLIEGHTDERGTNEYNMVLGERRARASMGHLVAHGVAADRITIISYGEERSACSERTEACWAKNRRAHFLVSPR